MTKTISEQLRDYFKMVPPSAEKVAEVRKNWKKARYPHMALDIAINDSDVGDVLVENARNDNKESNKK